MRLYFLILILFAFFKASCPSITLTLRYKDENGKIIVMIVADRMCLSCNMRDFGNFDREWRLQRAEGRIITLKPDEYEVSMDMNAVPLKILLAGRGKTQIGTAFTGHARTMKEFGRKMRRKRGNKIRNLFEYNTIDEVAWGLEMAHRRTIVNDYEKFDQGEFQHYSAQGKNIYGVTVGRHKPDMYGRKSTYAPKVRKLHGNLYSAGWNEDALNYLEPLFGPANREDWQKPFKLETFRTDEVKQHVRNAMRLNARDSAEQGAFAVTENFDAYIFSPNEKPIYWEHEPPFEPDTKARLEGYLSPVETMKNLIKAGHVDEDITRRFQLTPEQSYWKEIAMRELEHERDLKLRRHLFGETIEDRESWLSSRPVSSKTMQHGESVNLDPQKRPNSPNRAKIGSTHEKKPKPKPHKHYRQRMRGKKNVGLKAPSRIPHRARGG